MSKRNEHTFRFSAAQIAAAALKRSEYHEKRAQFWKGEYDNSVSTVEKTCGAKVVRQQITGGYRVDVAVDYGDPVAYRRMRESYDKLETHQKAAASFLSDHKLYATQVDRAYEMDVNDVQYYGLDGRSAED